MLKRSGLCANVKDDSLLRAARAAPGHSPSGVVGPGMGARRRSIKGRETMSDSAGTSGSVPDSVKLEVFKHLYASVAEEMGVCLQRASYSPNIKERRDYSCAVFDSSGLMVAQAAHMPVHLGSMPLSVRAAIDAVPMSRGDVVALNDPYHGGTHLPDITLVSPVFLHTGSGGSGSTGGSGPRVGPEFYVASRAHHADVGGSNPGSMGTATEVYQEGLRIPPVRLADRRGFRSGVLSLLMANVRTPDERRGDLAAQLSSVRLGERRLGEMARRYGPEELLARASALQRYSERLMRAAISEIPDGDYQARDFLDDDGVSSDPVPIAVRLSIAGDSATADFTGSAPQCAGNVNAVYAVTLSAAFYVFRCLAPYEIPSNWGCMAPIRVIAPEGTVVNPVPPAAVGAGNVETSQRIVDVLFAALASAGVRGIPAASSGSMSNVAIGGQGRDGRPFSYYETVAGGAGANETGPGPSAVHTHMTNTLNTPIEAIESAYPIRVIRYERRRGTGGRGRHRGGDGIVREIELLADAQVSVLSDRRRFAPPGLDGGRAGARGVNELRRGRVKKRLPSKISFNGRSGDVLSIRTPGGGGFGKERKGR
jgi:N-methylhydantoinase B